MSVRGAAGPVIKMLLDLIFISLVSGDPGKHHRSSDMDIIPAHRPVKIMSRFRKTCLGIIKIPAVICRKIEPASCPCKFIVKAAPRIVEPVCRSVSVITSGRIGKFIKALCMLKTKLGISFIRILKDDSRDCQCRCGFPNNGRSGVILCNAI